MSFFTGNSGPGSLQYKAAEAVTKLRLSDTELRYIMHLPQHFVDYVHKVDSSVFSTLQKNSEYPFNFDKTTNLLAPSFNFTNDMQAAIALAKKFLNFDIREMNEELVNSVMGRINRQYPFISKKTHTGLTPVLGRSMTQPIRGKTTVKNIRPFVSDTPEAKRRGGPECQELAKNTFLGLSSIPLHKDFGTAVNENKIIEFYAPSDNSFNFAQ